MILNYSTGGHDFQPEWLITGIVLEQD